MNAQANVKPAGTIKLPEAAANRAAEIRLVGRKGEDKLAWTPGVIPTEIKGKIVNISVPGW